MKPDLLESDELQEGASCPDWRVPRRDVRPVGFPSLHSHEGVFNVPTIAAEDFDRLAREVAQLRAQFSQALLEVEKKVSAGMASRVSPRKTRRPRTGPGQSFLPILPTELALVADAIENSKVIFNRLSDPLDENALSCSRETWQRATQLLTDHALSVWEKAKVTIRPPTISAGPEGSVDLYWTAAPYGLLLNVPADPRQPATYFGDAAANPDSNRTSGKIDPTKPIDVGVLMWLAHTAVR